ncbi:PREDICTED: nuclear pore complex protein Nup50 [Cyphomyrmex costatus]|uniref:Nuclear pore complex protein Nup50 n=1 Tax=Cyphomyrmex costatus TaxID=456900 RepID=A0A195CBP5_9HYME|nr:PREDICTED: nuclear pore complex protein Nup50 [Cyphomyrmex costatus]KYM97533.1 Nuclear pore complex protein Nup50 [Cyphomyrmex costatus]
MSSKRTATTELNHDNWNEENEPEDAGTFVLASNDILEKRVIKTARRRLPSKDGSPTKSAFGSFTGFKTTPSLSPFGFLANASTTSSMTTSTATTVNTSNKQTASNGAPKISEIDTDKRDDVAKLQTPSSISTSKKNSVEQGTEKTRSHSSDYYAKLKGLNESVTTWIKSHVDANPFCILTPIFKDYERYLKEITSKEESTKTQISHTSEHITQAAKNDSKQDISSEKKSEKKPGKSLFGNSNANAKSTLTVGTELKPEKSIFSNITANTKSVFSSTEQKTDNLKSVFGSTDITPDKSKSIFGSTESNIASKNVFGNTSVESNPLLNKSTVSDSANKDEEETNSNAKSVAPTFPTFSFGQSSTTSNVTAGFSFGSAKPFSFAPQAVKPQESEDKADNENKDEEDEEPPKPDFKPITEEGATYEQRCKVFIKKGNIFTDRGIGMLYLKPTPNGKTQLIVRANTALGNLLLNTLLTQSIPTKRMNKNTIMLVCLPMPDSSPPPVSVLLRVKTSEDADELLEALNKHKK